MPKIIIYKYRFMTGCFFHGYSGSIAVVQNDRETSRCFEVCPNTLYCGEKDRTSISPKLKIADKIELYSKQPYDGFKAKFIEKYGERGQKNAEKFCPDNCAEMVNFTMDYFFPETSGCLEIFYKTYQSLFCLLCIGTGGLECCPVPPCFNSPDDVIRRAKLLRCKYGSPGSDSAISVELESKEEVPKTPAVLAMV